MLTKIEMCGLPVAKIQVNMYTVFSVNFSKFLTKTWKNRGFVQWNSTVGVTTHLEIKEVGENVRRLKWSTKSQRI